MCIVMSIHVQWAPDVNYYDDDDDDDAGIGSTGTGSLANSTTNVTQVNKQTVTVQCLSSILL